MAKRDGLNVDAARIAADVMGTLSLEQAAIRLNYGVGREGLRLLKMGKIGREETVRVFASGFAEKFCERYGDEIRAAFGDCNEQAAADWFAEKCGFRSRRPVTRESNLDDVDVRQFAGARNLPESDAMVINDMLRGAIDAALKRNGLD